jgi:hypothetical protein
LIFSFIFRIEEYSADENRTPTTIVSSENDQKPKPQIPSLVSPNQIPSSINNQQQQSQPLIAQTANQTKTNIIQLKPFDNSIFANNNNSVALLEHKQSTTPGLLSRDNSILYNQSSKYALNENSVLNNFQLL